LPVNQQSPGSGIEEKSPGLDFAAIKEVQDFSQVLFA